MFHYVPVPPWLPSFILALLITQRVLELVIARRNTARLLENGAHEVGAEHYPYMLMLHTFWIMALVAWVIAVPPRVNAYFFLFYAILLGLRVWVISSLGPFWTTRIITIPNLPLVRRGPYKYVRHPNYIVVAAEIAVVPLMFAAWEIALIFSALNAWMMRVRIGAENKALAARA